MILDKHKNISSYTIIFLISIFSIFRYQGILPAYSHSKFYLENDPISNDIYFNNKFPTFVYDIFNFDFTNDFKYFILYAIVCANSYFFTYKILKEIIKIDKIFIFLSLLILAGLDSFLLHDVKSALSPHNQSPSTIITWSLFPALIYYTVKKNFLILSLIIFFKLLISLKYGLIPSLAILTYFFLQEKKNYKKFYLLIPFTLALVLILTNNISKFDNKIISDLKILNLIISNAGDLRDYFVFKQNFTELIFFFFSFLLYFYKIKKIKKLNKIFFIIGFLSIAVSIFDYIYFTFFFSYFPDLRLFMMSSTNNMVFYQYCFVILLCYVISNLKTNLITKILFFISIIYINIEGVVIISRSIGAILILAACLSYYISNNKKINVERPIVILSLIIILYLPILYINYQRFNSAFSINLLKLGSKKFYSEISGIKPLEEYLLHLAKCKNIHTQVIYKNSKYLNNKKHLLSLRRINTFSKNEYHVSYHSNLIAKKSFFYEENMANLNKENFIEHLRRKKIIEWVLIDLKYNYLDHSFIYDQVELPLLLIISNDKKVKINIYNKNNLSKSHLKCLLNK